MFDNTGKIEFPEVINGTGCMLNNYDTERRGFLLTLRDISISGLVPSIKGIP
jgi:hypothetical protein